MYSIIDDYSKEELQNILDSSCTFAEVLRKLNMTDHGNNRTTLNKRIEMYDLDLTKLNENRERFMKEQRDGLHEKKIIPIEDIILHNKSPTYKPSGLSKRLVSEGYKEYKCERCGISSWQGKPLSLQLHHKDEDKTNHYIDNLELLCPNCHSQTDGYAGRKIKIKRIMGKYNKMK